MKLAQQHELKLIENLQRSKQSTDVIIYVL